MAGRFSATTKHFALACLRLPHRNPNPNPNPNPNFNFSTLTPSAAAALLAPFLGSKRRRKLKKKQESPRKKPIQPEPVRRHPHLESILERDAAFRFLTRTKSFLSRRPGHRIPLADAGKLHRELGFPRGRKLSRSAVLHPLLLHLPPPTNDSSKPHLAFTPLMLSLLAEERSIENAAEPQRITAVRKLLMLSKGHRIPLAKLHHCRLLFGLPDDFRDRVKRYPHYFRVAIDNDSDRHVLELAEWDPALAVSVLERDFVPDEDRVRKTFNFPVPHGKSLPLDEDDERRMDSLSTLPLISPYTDGSGLDLWTVEAEKYRVGVLHEFLNLTLEKRASIHHIVEFKEEFCLTRHTYQMLMKQPRAFYLAGTEMNWAVFLKHAYREDGTLIDKDPQVVFDEKLRRIASMKEGEAGDFSNECLKEKYDSSSSSRF